MICSAFVGQMKPVFDRAGFRYEILYGNDIPDFLEKAVDLDGHIQRVGVCCVKSDMNPDDVHRIMLQMWMPSKYGEAPS